MQYRIGVDVGGTFTDFTIIKETGELFLWKEDTTPQDPAIAIAIGLKDVAANLGITIEQLMRETSVFVHGTTVATNMLIERNGPRIALFCTEGFRDILDLRDGYKPERFNLHLKHPGSFVERWLRFGIPQRMDNAGKVVKELDEDAVRNAAKKLKELDVKAVAVSYLWSMLNPEHELRTAEILKEELPNVFVVCSHIVLPEIREWERTSATVLSAYILPRVNEYLRELEKKLLNDG